MNWRVVLRSGLFVLLILLIQSTVGLDIRIAGVHPDIMWLLPIGAALSAGPEEGAIMGFWAGLAADLLLPTPFGLSALVGCLLGFSAGLATAAIDKTMFWLPGVVALAGSAAAVMLYAVLGAVLGQQQMLQSNLVAIVLVVSLFNAVLAWPVTRLTGWAIGAKEGDSRTLVSAGGSAGGRW